MRSADYVTRLDYAYSLLHGTSAANIHKLQCAQNTHLACRVVQFLLSDQCGSQIGESKSWEN